MAKKAQPTAADDAEDLPLNSSLGFLVREIHRMQSRVLQDRLRSDGISGGGWYFLRVLWCEDGLTQRELSQRIGVNEATARTAVDRMEQERLVVRVQDPTDRRKWIVQLTPRAKALKAKLLHFAIETNDMAMVGLSAADRDALLRQLRHVHSNLGKMSNAPDRRRRSSPPSGPRVGL